jgi:solute carrier family 6 GABA transporter-like protein 1
MIQRGGETTPSMREDNSRFSNLISFLFYQFTDRIRPPLVDTMSAPEVHEVAEQHGEMAEQHTDDSKRQDDDVWSSRPAFYFAAVGAAVGFGNVWRFPSLSVEYGGGAFFIPYFLAFFIIGVPILILEIGFGQFWQTGDVGVFGSFNPRLRGVGVASVACGWMLVVYYGVLIAWVINAFFDAFGDNAPWADEGVTGDIAITYFLEEIIGTSTLGESQRATRMVWANVGYSALGWLCIWSCLAFGTKVTGRIAYFTMGIPIIVLAAFLIKSLTLTGASDGIKIYIGEWDVSVLTERGDVWSAATTQIFFSLGITFGIMTAFGSHCKRHEPAFLNSVVIATANTTFSVVSGFAVFAALGHLAFLEGVGVEDLNFGGFSLVFGTWPVVLGTLPGGIHWVRLLFFDLFLLGLDSAFAFLEGILTVTSDTEYFKDTAKWKMSGGYCLLSFILSLMYCTDAGLNWLDAIDYYINFVMTLVGFFETFGAGWVYGIEDQIKNVGHKAGK